MTYDEECQKLFGERVREVAKAMEAAGHVVNLETCKQVAIVTSVRNILRTLDESKRLGGLTPAEHKYLRWKGILCVVMLGTSDDDGAPVWGHV
jgi:hypothetical protein